MADFDSTQGQGAVPAAAMEDTPLLVGRLRRWHRTGEWGFIFSDLHNCDVFVDAASCQDSAALKEGDFVLFELGYDEEGQTVAQNARKAEPQEVEQQQVTLGPVYAHKMARQPQVPELPKSTTNGAGTSSSSITPAVRDAPPAMVGPYEATGGRQNAPSAPPMAAALPRQQMDSYRQPPPPPPQHPAPTGPGGFPQAINSGAMMHQQPYMAPQQQQQQHHPYAYNAQGQGYGMYQQQGPWPGGNDPHALAVGQGNAPGQVAGPPGARLLLQPPTVLNDRERLDVKVTAMVAVLKGAGWTGQRAQTFRSSRNGAAMQIGQEWCEILRQAVQHADHGDEMEGRQHTQGNTGAWGDQQQWMWGAGTGMGQMDGAHGVGGDAYNGNNQMVNPVGISNALLGMHAGEPGYAAG